MWLLENHNISNRSTRKENLERRQKWKGPIDLKRSSSQTPTASHPPSAHFRLYKERNGSCLDDTYFSYISSRAFLLSSSCTCSLSRRSSSWAQRTLSSMFWRLRYSLSFCRRVTVCCKVVTYRNSETCPERVVTSQGGLSLCVSHKNSPLKSNKLVYAKLPIMV